MQLMTFDEIEIVVGGDGGSAFSATAGRPPFSATAERAGFDFDELNREISKGVVVGGVGGAMLGSIPTVGTGAIPGGAVGAFSGGLLGGLKNIADQLGF